MKVADLLLELRIGGPATQGRPPGRFVPKVALKAIAERETEEAELADRRAEAHGLDPNIRGQLAGEAIDPIPGSFAAAATAIDTQLTALYAAAVEGAARFQELSLQIAEASGTSMEVAAAALET